MGYNYFNKIMFGINNNTIERIFSKIRKLKISYTQTKL